MKRIELKMIWIGWIFKIKELIGSEKSMLTKGVSSVNPRANYVTPRIICKL